MASFKYAKYLGDYLNENNMGLIKTWARAYRVLGKTVMEEQLAVTLELGEKKTFLL